MPRTPKFVPPFLEVTLRAEGRTLVRVERQDPTLITAEKFEADLYVHADARRLACAVTLLETSMALIGNSCPAATARLRTAVARLIIQDTPWGQMIEEETDDGE